MLRSIQWKPVCVCMKCVSVTDSVLWVMLLNMILNMIHKGCLPRLTYVHRLHILLYLLKVLRHAFSGCALLLFLLREPITTLLSQTHQASGPHCFTYCVTCDYCLEGGIRNDADVARVRQLLQETADIKLWHEERKASYFQTTFGLHKSCCMAGCKVFASRTWCLTLVLPL